MRNSKRLFRVELRAAWRKGSIIMLEVLQKNVESLAEEYTDLIKSQIMKTKKATGNDGSDTSADSNSMEIIYEGIRTLNHVASVLERIDRIQRRNACGQGEELSN